MERQLLDTGVAVQRSDGTLHGRAERACEQLLLSLESLELGIRHRSHHGLSLRHTYDKLKALLTHACIRHRGS